MRTLNLRILAAIAVIVMAAGPIYAQPSGQFTPFQNFVVEVQTANPNNYVGQPGNLVRDAAAFEEMRQHILNIYEGVAITHSYVLDSHTFDCVPVLEQPGVRLRGLGSIASPPPANGSSGAPGGDTAIAGVNSQLPDDTSVDAFGNKLGCAEGTIPMWRITLEDLARWATLQDFFHKSPGESVPGSGVEPKVTATHKYSYTIQSVNNEGGNSSLNLWKPHVNTTSGEIFSLSQQWYVGGSGSGTQTAEVGWQNYPALWGSQKSALFIYYTADDYNKTGCYNLTCTAFVQTSSSWHFGVGFTNYSTVGGTQYEFTAQFKLYQGNWWLFLGASSSSLTAVGYYPGSVYNGGQMSVHAQVIEYGTEGVGTTVWPPEGSGRWPSKGFSYAAYQRDLFYIDTTGTSQWDSLTPEKPSPTCYKVSKPSYSSSSGWGIYFYEGGPGGTTCQ